MACPGSVLILLAVLASVQPAASEPHPLKRPDGISPRVRGNAVLRWNACARVINRNPDIAPEPESVGVPHLLE